MNCPRCGKPIGGYVQAGSKAASYVSQGKCPHCGCSMPSGYKVGFANDFKPKPVKYDRAAADELNRKGPYMGVCTILNGVLGCVFSILNHHIVIGILFGGFQALMPLMTGLNGVPKLALGPLFIIWFGLGLKSKVLISALMVFFLFTFNLYSGVRNVDRELILAVRLLGGSRRQVLWKVIWPASLPWLLASLRTGLGLSISGAIVGEYLGASRGLGWAISAAGERYNVEQVLCYVLVIIVLVVLLDAVVRLLEKRLLRWR